MRTFVLFLMLLMLSARLHGVEESIDRLTSEIAKHPAPIRMPGL